MMFLAAIAAAFWLFARGGSRARARSPGAGRRIRAAAGAPAPAGTPGTANACLATSPDQSSVRAPLRNLRSGREVLIANTPELQALTWIDPQSRNDQPTRRRPRYRASGRHGGATPCSSHGGPRHASAPGRDLGRPVFAAAARIAPGKVQALAAIAGAFGQPGQVPWASVLAGFSVDNLLRYGTPAEVLSRYTVTLLDAPGQVLAGTPAAAPHSNTSLAALGGRPALQQLRHPITRWAMGWCCVAQVVPHLAGRGGQWRCSGWWAL